MIRTLVCASSELARVGLVAIVRGDARLTVAGESTPDSLAARVRASDPDVVLEERASSTTMLATPSVVLVDDPASVWANERDARVEGRASGTMGAHAILARDASPEEIVAAIVAVAAGLVAVQPHALEETRERFRVDAPFDRPTSTTPPGERLTPREIDVLGELARGVPNKIIATRLRISEHTVKYHVASIFAKLAVASRTEAVTQGVRRGLIML